MVKNLKKIKLGKDVKLSENIIFKGIKKNSGSIFFGDYSEIHDDCRFFIDDKFQMGDYGTIHNNTLVQSYEECIIGHNAWIGQNSIINATNKLTIGNNFGIGAGSKIWTHAFYGELLLGCKIAVGIPDYESKSGDVKIGDDFWGIGQITISPGVTIGNKVIALTNSLVTQNVPDNTIVGGIPAKPIKIEGDTKAYKDLTVKEKFNLMKNFSKQFSKIKNVKIKINEDKKIIILGNNEIILHCNKHDKEQKQPSYFDIIKRVYTKKHNKLEREFIFHTIKYKARFVPE